jgi:uncharacterized delta-60 repeat protein
MKPQLSSRITRRTFLDAGAAGSATGLGGGIAFLAPSLSSAASPDGACRTARRRDVRFLTGLTCLSVLLVAHAATAQPGSVDTSFGSGGFVLTDVTGNGGLQGPSVIKTQPDDQKLVVGGSAQVAGGTGMSLFLARYNANGSLDTGFGSAGVVRTNITTSVGDNEYLEDLVIQTDGKIVVAVQLPATSKKSGQTFGVLRYTEAGVLDTTFGAGGLVNFAFTSGTDAYVRAVAVDSRGIVVAGTSGDVLAVARLNGDGSFDSTFGSGGKATYPGVVAKRLGPSIFAMALDNSSRPVLVGSLYALSLIVRLTTAGALDTTFASKGWTTVDYGRGGGTESFRCLAFDGNNIVAGGRADTAVNRAPPLADVALVRFTPSGAFDTTFGIGGKVVQDINGTFDIVQGLAIQSGSIIVAAEASATDYSTADTVIARFTPGGALDTGFGAGGFTFTDFGATRAYPYGVTAQIDNNLPKVVVVSSVNQPFAIALARYLE